MLVLALPFIRGRLPLSRVQGPNARAHSTSDAGHVYLKNKTFWFIVLATLLQGLAYFIPILWLPCMCYIDCSVRINTDHTFLQPTLRP